MPLPPRVGGGRGGRDPPGCGGECGSFPAAEGKCCHCSQRNEKKKSLRAVAVSRSLVAGEAELVQLYSAALEKLIFLPCLFI